MDDFIDVVQGNAVRIPCLYVLNKVRAVSAAADVGEVVVQLDSSQAEPKATMRTKI